MEGQKNWFMVRPKKLFKDASSFFSLNAGKSENVVVIKSEIPYDHLCFFLQ